MNAQKNLLTLSKNALQLCHEVYGMDFKKPYVILEGTGKFTANSIGKMISEKTGLTYHNAVTAFFMEDTNKYRSKYEKIRFIKFDDTFEPVDTMKGLYGGSGTYRYITNYYRKSDFEADRKKGDARYWVIIQDKKYIKEKSVKTIDFGERYRLNYASSGACVNVSKLHDKKNGASYKYSGSYYYGKAPSGAQMIDKSGYLRWNNVSTYQTKAKALKAERNKAAANVYNCFAENAKIEQAIRTLRTRIAEKVLSGANAYDLSCILGKINSLERYYKIHSEKVTEKSYNSVESIQRELNDLNERIVDINSKLDEL